MDLDLGEKGENGEEWVFGIEKIEVHRPGRALVLSDCNS